MGSWELGARGWELGADVNSQNALGLAIFGSEPVDVTTPGLAAGKGFAYAPASTCAHAYAWFCSCIRRCVYICHMRMCVHEHILDAHMHMHRLKQ